MCTLLGAVGTRMTKEDTAPALTIQQRVSPSGPSSVTQNCSVTSAGMGRSRFSGSAGRSNYSTYNFLIVLIQF